MTNANLKKHNNCDDVIYAKDLTPGSLFFIQDYYKLIISTVSEIVDNKSFVSICYAQIHLESNEIILATDFKISPNFSWVYKKYQLHVE